MDYEDGSLCRSELLLQLAIYDDETVMQALLEKANSNTTQPHKPVYVSLVLVLILIVLLKIIGRIMVEIMLKCCLVAQDVIPRGSVAKSFIVFSDVIISDSYVKRYLENP